MRHLIESTDPRMLFGFGVLMVITTLALIIALGKVHQESSYGLEIVLGGLNTLSGAFAQWAFSRIDKQAIIPVEPLTTEKPKDK